MQYSNKAYLLIGGNIGNRPGNLQEAARMITACCGVVEAASPVYETAAWGNLAQPPFLNQALRIATPCDAPGLMQQLLRIEEGMGRVRAELYGPRTIDLDILLFNNEIRQTDLVTVPHPELQNRRFALQPLADIAPAVVHPVFGKTILQLLEECPDALTVTQVSAPG